MEVSPHGAVLGFRIWTQIWLTWSCKCCKCQLSEFSYLLLQTSSFKKFSSQSLFQNFWAKRFIRWKTSVHDKEPLSHTFPTVSLKEELQNINIYTHTCARPHTHSHTHPPLRCSFFVGKCWCKCWAWRILAYKLINIHWINKSTKEWMIVANLFFMCCFGFAV